MLLPLSFLSHATFSVTLLSNPVDWPSWAAWIIAPITSKHNVVCVPCQSHVQSGSFFKNQFYLCKVTLLCVIRRDCWQTLSPTEQNGSKRAKCGQIYTIKSCFPQSEQLFITSWFLSNNNSDFIWLSADWPTKHYKQCSLHSLMSYLINNILERVNNCVCVCVYRNCIQTVYDYLIIIPCSLRCREDKTDTTRCFTVNSEAAICCSCTAVQNSPWLYCLNRLSENKCFSKTLRNQLGYWSKVQLYSKYTWIFRQHIIITSSLLPKQNNPDKCWYMQWLK